MSLSKTTQPRLHNEMAHTARHLSDLLQRFDNMMPFQSSTHGLLQPFLEESDFNINQYMRIVHDDEKETHMKVDMPGVDKSNVDISYEGKKLRWKAHREDETQSEDGTKSKSTVDFSGMYSLPYVPTGLKASLENGTLSMVITKPENLENQAVKVVLE